MMGSSFETFDPARYQRVPALGLAATVALARALLEREPTAGVTARVSKRALGLAADVAETGELLEKLEPELLGLLELEAVEEALWESLRGSLLAWRCFAPGKDPDPDAGDIAGFLAEGRHFATRADALADELFGAEAVDASQRLRRIDEGELGDELAKLAGRSLIPALFACHTLREEALAEAGPELGRRLAELRQRRRALARRIASYNLAVLALLDEDEPESLELVRAALDPMTRL